MLGCVGGNPETMPTLPTLPTLPRPVAPHACNCAFLGNGALICVSCAACGVVRSFGGGGWQLLGRSSLHLAAYHGQTAAVDALVELGALLNTTSSPLSWTGVPSPSLSAPCLCARSVPMRCVPTTATMRWVPMRCVPRCWCRHHAASQCRLASTVFCYFAASLRPVVHFSRI